MSSTVDSRVVEMRFDNSHFERNVSTTMSTLDKLKQKLNLSGASKGLEDVNAAAKHVDMSGLGGAVDTVKAKFSALDVVAITALTNITNSAVNAGKKLVSSLTIDQVTAGWQKFSDKTTSVATLVAQGNAIEDVNKELNRLNWYTDETSYNFTDMVSNIAKFTATGKGLEESVTAMEGIANWAAVSGQNASTASRAMYQLSQAMGAGVLRLEDYKSIQNASMDTEEFRQKCIDAAIELKTLKKVGNDTYSSLVATGKKGAEAFNISQFTTHLTDGAWLTSEVMMKVFNDYSAAVNGIYEAAEEKGMLASEIIDEIHTTAEQSGISTDEAIKKLGYSFDSFALKAFEAAQKARTFGDAIDSVKDAVSTGWMNTFELIFGDAEGATKLWTDVANQLYDIFASGGERRNEILEGAMLSKWDVLIERINDAGIETDTFEKKIRELAEASGGSVEEAIQKYGSLSEAFKAGAIDVKYLKEAVDFFNGSAEKSGEVVNEVVKGLSVDLSGILPGKYGESVIAWGSDATESVKKIQTALVELGYASDNIITGEFGSETREALLKFQKEAGLALTGVFDKDTLNAMQKAGESLERVGEAAEGAGKKANGTKVEIDDLVDGISKMSGRELVFGTIHNTLAGIVGILGTFRDAWAEVFPVDRVSNGLRNFLEGLYELSEKLILSKENADKLKRVFKGVISVFDMAFSAITTVARGIGTLIGKVTGFTGGILTGAASFGDYLSKLRDTAEETGVFGAIVDKVVGFLSNAIDKVKEFGKEIADKFKSDKASGIFGFFKGLWDIVKDVGAAVVTTFGQLGGKIAEALGKGDVFEVLNSGVLVGIFIGIKKFVSSLTDAFDGVGGFMENVTGVLDSVRGCLEAYQQQLKAGALLKIAAAVGILAAALWVLSTIDADDLGNAIAAISGLFIELVVAMAVLDKLSGTGALKPLESLGKGLNKFATGIQMIGLAVAVAILAFAAKTLSDLSWEDIGKSLAGIAGMVMILVAAAKIMDSEYSKITKFAGQMILMSVAVGILAGVAKIFASISWEGLTKAGMGITGAVVLLVAAAKIMDSESSKITKFAGQMILMSVAVGILAGVAKIFASMSWEGLAKGGAGILGAVVLLVAAAKIMDSETSKITKFAGQMILMSVAVGILAGVAKIFAAMSWEGLAKGGAGILGAVVLLVAAAKIMDSETSKITKFAGQMILMSVAIAILSSSMKKLGSMSWGEIAKGLVALAGAFAVIGIAGLLLSPLIGPILALAGAFALLGIGMLGIGAGLVLISAGITALGVALAAGTTSIIAGLTVIVSGILELIPTIARIIGEGIVEIAKVIGEYAPQLAESFLQLLTSVLQSLSEHAPQITDALFELLVNVINSLADHTPALMEAILNLFVKMFSGLADALKNIGIGELDDALNVALGLAGLMLAMSIALKIAGSISIGSALKGILALTAMVIPLLAFVGVLAVASNINNAMDNALALTVLMGACSLMLLPLTLVGTFIGPALLGIAALTAMAIPMVVFVGILALMNNVDNAMANAVLLGNFMSLMARVLVTISLVAPLAVVGVAAMDGLVLLMGAIALLAVGIGVLMEKVPGLQSFLDTGLPILEKLAGSIGTMIGNFVTSLGVAVTDGFVKMADNLATCMDKLQQACDKAKGIDSSSFDGVGDLLGVIIKIGKTSVKTSISDTLSKLFSGKDSMTKFADDGEAFFKAMKRIGDAASEVNIDNEAFSAIMDTAEQLSGFQKTLTPIGGVMDWFTGRDDLETFGENVASFITSMGTAYGSLTDMTLNTAAMDSIISAATSLSNLQSSLESVGGVMEFFNGKSDIGTFGENVASFVTQVSKAYGTLGDTTFNTEAMDSIISAATSLSKLQSSLESVGGVMEFFNGKSDIGTFGENVASFVTQVSKAYGTLGDTTLNTAAMDSIISAATKLATLQGSLENMGGVISWFNGRSDLGAFGTKIGEFATAMGTLKEKMGENGISESVITSVTNAGTAITELQKALPKEGWFDGKLNLSEFSGYITKFSEAMATFGNKAKTIDQTAVSLAMSTAYRIKNLMELLKDLDTSGVDKFVGGGLFSSSPVAKIASAISDFSDEIADVDVQSISTATTTATRLKGLISSLVGLDTSGVENFKPESIGKSIKAYSESVAGIDAEAITSSITAATRLKSFISSLADLDNSGITMFTPVRIGNSIKAYANSVAGIDLEAVTNSITAGKKIKSLINSLVDLDNSGIASFTPISIGESVKGYSDAVSGINLAAISNSIIAASKIRSFISSLSSLKTTGISSFASAVDELSRTNLSGVSETIAGYAETMQTSGQTLMTNLSTGIVTGLGGLITTVNGVLTKVVGSIKSRVGIFRASGAALARGAASGFASGRGSLISAASSAASAAASSINSYRSSFASAGAYLVKGFANGITLSTYVAENAAKNMAAKAAEAAKKELKQHSPSRVFMEIGEYTVKGFAIGLSSLGNEVEDSARGMAAKAITTTRTAMAAMLDTLNSDMDAQPTIKPVVDLSDVRTGVDAISGIFSGTQTMGVRSNLNAINLAMNDARQNGGNRDVISAINKLGDDLENVRGDTYNFGGFTYDDGSNVSDAVETLIRYARIGRRR